MGNLRHGRTMYERIRRAFEEHFGIGITDTAIAEHAGVSKHLVGKWKKGVSRPSYDALGEIARLTNYPIDYFVTGSIYGLHADDINHDTYEFTPAFTRPDVSIPPPLTTKQYPPNATRPREPINFVLNAKEIPVVGRAAADETQGSRAGFFPPDPEAHFDQVTIPETTAAVEIIGDSMSPVLLHGQFALLGPEYSGPYDHPKNYEIVVADIEVKDGDQAGSDERWEGVYCKRVVDAGDVWVFLSINQTGTPFSVAKANCRVWPVIGVWFAGKGKPPED